MKTLLSGMATAVRRAQRHFNALGPLALSIGIACSFDGPQEVDLSRIPLGELEPECRINGYQADLVPITWLGAAPDGTVALIQAQDNAVRFFNASCKARGSVGRQGEGPGEFQRPVRGGWIGDTLWVSDTGLDRVTLISTAPGYVRTLRPMASARPGPTNAGHLPEYSLVVPYALYPGDTALALGMIPIGLEPTDSAPRLMLLRVSADGTIQRGIMPPPQAGQESTVEMGRVLFYPVPQWAVAPDGKRIATLTFAMSKAVPDTFHVAAVDELGRSIFAVDVPFEPEPIPASVADSAVAARAAGSRLLTPTRAMQAEMRRAIPSAYPAADAVVVGSDHRTWIHLHDSVEGRPWLCLGPGGKVEGRIVLPLRNRIAAADRNALWVVERDSLGVESVVKYQYHFGAS